MRYISIDLDAGRKDRSQRWSSVWDKQHRFEDENRENGRIITEKEREEVGRSEINKG